MAETQELNSRRQRPFWGLILHPFLVAVFPILSLWANNLDEVDWTETGLPLVVSLMYAGLAVLGGRIVCGTWPRAAMAATLIVALTFSYKFLSIAGVEYLAWIPERVRLNTVPALWLLTVAGGCIGLRFAKFDEARGTRFLNFGALVLTVMPLVNIGTDAIRSALRERPSGGRPQPEEVVTLHPPQPARDIYYLVFDRYASRQTLRDHYGFDNQPFYDSLRQRGLHVADESCANYPHTIISISSTLNMRYHDQRIASDAYYARDFRNHRVGRLLKEQGYTFYHLGNWYGPLRRAKNADVNYEFSLIPTEFAGTVFHMTPFEPVAVRLGGGVRTQTLGQIKMLHDLVDRQEPKFVYAHFLVPHPPHVFDKDGSPIPGEVLAARTYDESYIRQLEFTNGEILKMVDDILRKSKTPPIIVVQSDEGPVLQPTDLDKEPIAKICKRSGILSAYYFPDRNPAELISPTISQVNTFRLIFNEYFDARLPLLEDRAYYWGQRDWDKPVPTAGDNFMDVTDAVHQRIRVAHKEVPQAESSRK